MPFTILKDGSGPPTDADSRTHEIYAYWRSICGSKRYPSRADFDPIDIPYLMPFVSLADVHENLPRFVYRLAGTKLVELLKKEITGHPVGYGVKAEELDSVLRRYAIVADTGAIVFQRDKTQEQSNDYTGVERLMLPFATDGAHVDMIMTIVIPLAASNSVGQVLGESTWRSRTE